MIIALTLTLINVHTVHSNGHRELAMARERVATLRALTPLTMSNMRPKSLDLLFEKSSKTLGFFVYISAVFVVSIH